MDANRPTRHMHRARGLYHTRVTAIRKLYRGTRCRPTATAKPAPTQRRIPDLPAHARETRGAPGPGATIDRGPAIRPDPRTTKCTCPIREAPTPDLKPALQRAGWPLPEPHTPRAQQGGPTPPRTEHTIWQANRAGAEAAQQRASKPRPTARVTTSKRWVCAHVRVCKTNPLQESRGRTPLMEASHQRQPYAMRTA